MRPKRSNFSPSIDPSFPRGNAVQTVIDVIALIFLTLFVCVTGVAIAGSLFLLLFIGL